VQPAVIWADQRSAPELEEMQSLVEGAGLAYESGTAPAAGFMGATLRWFKRNQPAALEQTSTVLLPKDYVRYRLTGNLATEASDASSTALFDIRKRRWSSAIIRILGLPEHIWPAVVESATVVGTLTHDAAEALGLSAGVRVTAGCADQVAQAIGNGLVEPGVGSVTIGTGGQLFAPLLTPQTDPRLRIHTFCHAPAARWYMLGAMLAAGLSLRWLRDLHGLTSDPHAYDRLSELAAQVKPGSDGLIFLPYLVGERAPLMDAQARGCFIGLTLGHSLGHLARAIMEGVAFGLRQILEVMTGLNTPINHLLASGGGLQSPSWRQLVADVLNRPLRLASGQERAGVGAALIAGIGTGLFADYAQTAQVVSSDYSVTEPNAARVVAYSDRYAQFVDAYPRLKTLLHDLGR